MKSIIVFLLLTVWMLCTLILALSMLGILMVAIVTDGDWFLLPQKLIDKL